MTKLLDYLAPWWRAAALPAGIARAIGQPFDEWRALLTGLASFFDAQGAPTSWLDWLMDLVGFYPQRSLSEVRKRNLIARAGEIWRAKGTGAGIEAYLRAIAGVESGVEDFVEHAFIAGISRAGDICGPGDSAWFFFVIAPYDIQMQVNVEAIIEPVTPAFCDFLVNYIGS